MPIASRPALARGACRGLVVLEEIYMSEQVISSTPAPIMCPRCDKAADSLGSAHPTHEWFECRACGYVWSEKARATRG